MEDMSHTAAAAAAAAAAAQQVSDPPPHLLHPPLPSIDSLVPRVVSKAWKQAKSRAEVSLTFFDIVATSPLVGLLPALIPPSPRSPSNALILLCRSRMNTTQMQKSSSRPATDDGPNLHYSDTTPPPPSSSASSSSAPGTNLLLVHAESVKNTSETMCGTRTWPCSSSATSPFHNVKLTHTMYLCLAWTLIWIWGFMRKCYRYSCVFGRRPAHTPPFPQKDGVVFSSLPHSSARKSPHPNISSSSSSSHSRSSSLTLKNSAKDLSAIAHNINSSSKHLKRKLRSSFKSLSVQVPRRALAPLNYHFTKSPSSSTTYLTTSASPASCILSPLQSSCKASPLISPFHISCSAKVRSAPMSTAVNSATVTNKLSKDSFTASNSFYDTLSPPLDSSRRSSLSSGNDNNASSSLSSDEMPSDEKLHVATPSPDSVNGIPSNKIIDSHLIAWFTICLALGGLIFSKLIAAIAVTGCWFVLRPSML